MEAGLVWTIGKRYLEIEFIFLHFLLYCGVLMKTIFARRRAEENFPGSDIILKQLKEKPSKKRVGIISKGAPGK